VRELQAGVWHWQAPHPDWTPDGRWPQEVSSYAIDDGARILLFDPLSVPDELLGLAADREPVVVLTAPWHERDTQSLVERLGVSAPVAVFVPPPDTAEDLVRKYGITLERAAGGSPDVAWLLAGDGGAAHLYAAGDQLPVDIEVFPGREQNDLVLWIESVRAVVAGDTLVDFGRGLQINEWLREGVTREQVVEGLRPLLRLPVEVVLPAHGAPTDRAALERALS
jgi:glyoxylase-like metal-dependent hydrolase (beta-lactamase superfamily II)